MLNGGDACPSGDEYAATRNGNNNWYGHDNEMTWFDWDALEAQRDSYFRFYRLTLEFVHTLLCNHGSKLSNPLHVMPFVRRCA